ncbi:hypothetical protein ACHAWF_004442, partial [Thalassiosira exigua]
MTMAPRRDTTSVSTASSSIYTDDRMGTEYTKSEYTKSVYGDATASYDLDGGAGDNMSRGADGGSYCVPGGEEASIDVVSLDDPARMSPQAIRAELRHHGVDAASRAGQRELEDALALARKNGGGRNGHNGAAGGGSGASPLGDHQQMQYRRNWGGGSDPAAAARVPGMKVKAPSHQRPARLGGADGLAPGATHIPLVGNKKIPPPILNVIKTSADPSMKAIELDDKPLGDKEAGKLIDALGSNRTVEFLSLRRCHLADATADKLGEALGRNETLVELRLDGNDVSSRGAAALSTALITNETLAVLTLSDNPAVGDEGVAYLIGALEHNAHLRTLDVSNCNVGESRLRKIDAILSDRQIDANFENLLDRLSDDDFRVTGIDLSGRRIGDVGASRLAEALADNTQVRQLWLRGCGVGDDGARALASCLEQNMAVVDLFLGNNEVGGAGMEALADALASSNETLVSLELDDNDVDAAGLDAFLKALEDNQSVLVASFENNPGGDPDRLEAIRDALQEKRDGLNLVSFVVDPDAASTTASEAHGGGSGIVNMSVCSSYMPSTYRRAGFSSQAGPVMLRDSIRSSGSHKFSVFHRDNHSSSLRGSGTSQRPKPGPPPPRRPRPQRQQPPPPPRSPPPSRRPSPVAEERSSSPPHSRTSSKKSGSGSAAKSGSPKSSSSPRHNNVAQLVPVEAPPTPNASRQPPPQQQQQQQQRAAPAPRASSPPPYAGGRSNAYRRAHVPVPLKAQALATIDESGKSVGTRSTTTDGVSDSRGGSGSRGAGGGVGGRPSAYPPSTNSELGPLLTVTECDDEDRTQESSVRSRIKASSGGGGTV